MYKGHSKRNEPEAFKKKRAGVWNVQIGDNIIVCVTKSVPTTARKFTICS